MTDLENLPTTKSGSVKKDTAMKWLRSLGEPDEDALKGAVVPEAYDHEGSTYDEPFSQIRVTGTPEFIEEVAKHFSSFVDFEDGTTRLSINLKQVEDRESGETRDDVYALYLSVAERGGQNKTLSD